MEKFNILNYDLIIFHIIGTWYAQWERYALYCKINKRWYVFIHVGSCSLIAMCTRSDENFAKNSCVEKRKKNLVEIDFELLVRD